ncbi:hypothetical protein ACFSO0_14905 [Brevibacillus sp. GCM10020057]|uniref:hypothetical protein n=1 Tax=Brevibacillus sp. GCM10020057 TaxID=3317327 RepID=UPI003634F967
MQRTSIAAPMETRRVIIRDFFELIDTIPNLDDPGAIQKLHRYLQSLLRIKQVVPPVVEIMTVVKEHKPVLFHAARRSLMTTSNLHMLFQVDMDVELARERLKQYAE